jgi:prepilin-type N-terminal cleavage/methylation domain-containing protein
MVYSHKELKRISRGFTLIELLVVVLIIGILAAIAIPQYNKVIEKARFAEIETNIAAIHQSMQRYFLQYGRWPVSFEDLDIDLPGALAASSVISSTKVPGGVWRSGKTEYIINSTNSGTIGGGCVWGRLQDVGIRNALGRGPNGEQYCSAFPGGGFGVDITDKYKKICASWGYDKASEACTPGSPITWGKGFIK